MAKGNVHIQIVKGTTTRTTTVEPTPDVCPGCGRCRHCGHPAPPAPMRPVVTPTYPGTWQPQPSPWWQQPYVITC